MDWKSIREKVIFWLVCGILGAVLPTYIEVKSHTKQIDMLQDELKNQKAETRRLYENIGDLVTEMMKVNPKAYQEQPSSYQRQTIDQGIPLIDPGSVAAAAPGYAALPVVPKKKEN